MTREQDEHLAKLQHDFHERLGEKYRLGQAEHGGDVWAKPCLKEALNEVIDQWVYLRSLEEKLKTVQAICDEGIIRFPDANYHFNTIKKLAC